MIYESASSEFRVSAMTRQIDGLALFVQPIREMARRSDRETSKRAALNIADRLNGLQRSVLSSFMARGPATAKVAEDWLEFKERYGYSTIRKRICELSGRGLLCDTGRVEAGCTVWSASTLSRAA